MVTPCHDLAECALKIRHSGWLQRRRRRLRELTTMRGSVMDILDLMILAPMSVLVVFFASVAVLEWWEPRTERRPDAQVIQHPHSDRKISSAA
jgi:hypothetical protein